MAIVIVNLVGWLKDFFYDKSDVDSLISHKQDTLVSGESIKTINNQNLLGSGNITIQGGGGSDSLVCVDDFYFDDVDEDLALETCCDSFVVTAWEQTLSDTKVASEKLTKTELDKKVEKSSSTGLLKNDGTVMTSGTGSSNWAVGNHNHTGTYAPNSHTHNLSDVNNTTTVDVVVTYTDSTTETIKLVKYTGT